MRILIIALSAFALLGMHEFGFCYKSKAASANEQNNFVVSNTSNQNCNLATEKKLVSTANFPSRECLLRKLLLVEKHQTPTPRPVLATADQLRQGEVLTVLRYRHFFEPGTAKNTGLTDQPTLGASWGVTNKLELTFDAQTVDNAGPVHQGPFGAERINPDQTGNNFFQEITLQAKQRLWQKNNQAISGVVAASIGNGNRPYKFFNNTGNVANGKNRQIVVSLELPYTIKPSHQLSLTLSPKVAFLPKDNALYFNRLPLPNSGSFGTTFGLAGGITYQVNPQLILWADSFLPFTGNNTINRNTGLTARTITYNAGLKYLLNPKLSADLFVSNALGNTGALSIVGDREHIALGFGLNYFPGNQYADHFGVSQQPSPSAYAGFGFLDGGTVPKNQLLLSLRGGGQGILPSLRYGLLDDLEIGAFLDGVSGTTDESLLGFSGKIRLLHQEDGDPVTLSVAATLARSNNVFVNFFNNDSHRFQELGLKKSGFAFSNENYAQAQLFVLTLSTPIYYKFRDGGAAWLTPSLGYVQRSGFETAGFNFGRSIPITKNLQAIAEFGLDLTGKGNALFGSGRQKTIPWSLGVRWQPFDEKASGLQLEAYLTNTVGSSPFENLRVRADNRPTIGFGMLLPVQF